MKISRKKAEEFVSCLKFSKDGLIPVAACDASSNQLLMLAYANREAVLRTLVSGQAYFFSRSRNALWKKGEVSGNFMTLISINTDCDNDALQYLVEVRGEGNACHTGRRSCFGEGRFTLLDLEGLLKRRKREATKGSYTVKLLKDRKLCAAKVVEEAGEVVEAYLEKHGRTRVKEEAADVLYHLLVLLISDGISLGDIERELEKRNKKNKRR